MSEDITENIASSQARRKRAWLIVLSVLITTALAAALAVSTVAAGQTPDPGGDPAAKVRALKDRAKVRGPGGQGFGMGGPIHGEFVAPKREGGFATYAMQRGETTAVSDSSITVRSEDGFSRTYAVNGETRVNRDGKISDIKNGARVGVMAVVEGGNARAVRVVDEAFKQRLHEKMRERRRSMRPGSFEGGPPNPPAGGLTG